MSNGNKTNAEVYSTVWVHQKSDNLREILKSTRPYHCFVWWIDNIIFSIRSIWEISIQLHKSEFPTQMTLFHRSDIFWFWRPKCKGKRHFWNSSPIMLHENWVLSEAYSKKWLSSVCLYLNMFIFNLNMFILYMKS